MRNIRYSLIISLVFFISNSLCAQYSWQNHGPDNLGSKTRALAFDSNGNLLAGSEGGGLWISSNKGLSWKRLTTYDGNPNVTSIAVNGSNIYVGTGATQFIRSPYETLFPGGFNLSTSAEGFLGYTGLPGGGVYVSTDNGATWSNDNGSQILGTDNYQGPFISIQKVTIGNGRVFVATRQGLYYSDDPELKLLIPAFGPPRFISAPIYDVEVVAGGVIFAGTADSLYVSRDGGNSFIDVKDPSLYTLGRLSFQRIAIAVSPTDPNVVYVAGTRSNGELSGIWRSTDAGLSWSNYAPSGNPGFTPLGTLGREAFTLEVFPQNANELIVAGIDWYTFAEEKGWTQTAQRFNPTASNFIPSKIYCVAFDPNDPETFFVGTDKQIVRSTDGGRSFSQKSKGYEAGRSFSVSAIPVEGEEAIISGTPSEGVILNSNYDSGLPSAQGFGDISPVNNGNVEASYLYPGTVVIQGADDGLLRSPSFGTAFETFYGFPISPGAAGLNPTSSDTIVDRSGPDEGGTGLQDRNGASMVPWVLDEVIPDEVIDQQKGKEDIQQLENYIFFCSRSYVWRVSYPFGNPEGLLPRWNRLSNALVSGSEFLTSIAVSGDEKHTLYVGTSRGNLYQIINPHDLENFDVNTHVIRLSTPANNLPLGRWISSIAVDPQNTNRIVITYAGYGGNISAFPSLMYYASNILAGFFLPVIDNIPLEPIYSSKFVVDPATNESVLFFGSESGLYTARDLGLSGTQVTPEFGPEVGEVPVYDIHLKSYVATITDEESQDFVLTRDNTVFVATHGRGIWSTTSLRSNRIGQQADEPVMLNEASLTVYPNPSEGETYLYLYLPEDSRVDAAIYSLDGRMIQVVMDQESFSAAMEDIALETERLAQGLYVLKASIHTATGVIDKHVKFVVKR